MPKHTGPRKQNGPRKRTGCITCKTAHVRCTEERPHCRRCNRLKLSCEYEFTLLWEEDAVQRGIAHGRKGVWSKTGKKGMTEEVGKDNGEAANTLPMQRVFSQSKEPMNCVFVNFEVAHFTDGLPVALLDEHIGDIAHDEVSPTGRPGSLGEQPASPDYRSLPDEVCIPRTVDVVDEEYDADSHDCTTPIHAMSIHFPRSITDFDLTNIETQLMDYYVHYLAPRCSLSTENPYLETLLPVAYEFAPLRHTLLAAAACQFFHFSRERRYEVESLRYRSKAIRGSKIHMERNYIDWKSLATMAMFCFRDITDNCGPAWILHLQIGSQMLRELRCTSKRDSELQNFCEIYFVAHEVMGRTGWEGTNQDMGEWDWMSDELYHEIDPIMGCSRQLISLISQITCLAADLQISSSQFTENTSRATRILAEIYSLRQVPRPQCSDAESIMQIAEIKRLLAMLYFHDRIVSQMHSAFSVADHLSSVVGLQRCIISCLQVLPASSGASLWPLFVLGKSKLLSSSQINFVLDRLAQLETSRYLGSVYHARRLIERGIGIMSTEHESFGRLRWADDGAVSENERWVSLA